MPFFVHVSDIHFGQERGGQVVINNDVKERLVEDAARELRAHNPGPAAGLLVTGDIAYAGKANEYQAAGAWLDRLAEAVGCAKTAVHLVPGNHDIDRNEISAGVELMLKDIATNGEGRLDTYLAHPRDRQIMYSRFAAYEPFAEAYNCPLDGGGGLAGDKPVVLAPGRTLRFIGLNTALICSKKDRQGQLLLGARQRVLPRSVGEELIVLAHHPLRWLQDGTDALSFVRQRARVLITGHEHNPSVDCEAIKDGCDILTLAAGATVPPVTDDPFTYTYNILEFEWEPETESLIVTVHPRVWVESEKDFGPDPVRLGGKGPQFRLGCPNFRAAASMAEAQPREKTMAREDRVESAPAISKPTPIAGEPAESMADERLPLLLLRFFRDLSPGQRVRVLVELGALPDDWGEPLTHGIERQVVEGLVRTDRLDDLEAAIDRVLQSGAQGGTATNG